MRDHGVRGRPTAAGDHITIVAHDIGPVGGMEMQISHLIGGLLERGRHVTAIARSCEVPDHELLTKVLVPGPPSPFPVAYPWFAMAGAAALARHGRGIVHAAGAIVPVPIDVTTIHFCHHAFATLRGPSRASRDVPAYRFNARVSNAMSRAGERLCYRPERVRAVIAISGGVRREVERQFPRLRAKVRTIPHGVDAQRFRADPDRRVVVRRQLGIDEDALVAIFVGGDWPRKGLEHAISAVAAASPWNLLVVGEGDQAAYRRLAEDAGAGGRVHFLGTSTDTSAQFSAADAFVLPTSYETFSLATYEAAASGLPMLVTEVSGPDELIADGVNGAFIRDSAAQTAEWLMRLKDRDLRATMGLAAREAAKPYTWDAVIDRHIELYDDIARDGRRHRSQ
jgi:glycosyltransferase involved in cell wall biosynthesis